MLQNFVLKNPKNSYIKVCFIYMENISLLCLICFIINRLFAWINVTFLPLLSHGCYGPIISILKFMNFPLSPFSFWQMERSASVRETHPPNGKELVWETWCGDTYEFLIKRCFSVSNFGFQYSKVLWINSYTFCQLYFMKVCVGKIVLVKHTLHYRD